MARVCGPLGGTLAELLEGLGGEGGVVGNVGLDGSGRIVLPVEQRAAVVLAVLAHAGEVLDNLDALGLEVVRRGDAAAMEDLGRVDGTGGQDDLVLGSMQATNRNSSSFPLA